MTGNRKTNPAGDDSGTNLHPSELPTELIDPAAWWRRPCEVDDRLYVCGDLPSDSEGFRRVLGEWLEAGITHIVDVRSEWSDADRVADAAPDLTYTWLGTHDDGGIQEAAWFDAGVDAITMGLGDPTARVLVHCHMGVNRAPSLAFAAMIELGRGVEEALDAIRSARPIAAIAYAADAARWFGERRSMDGESVQTACDRTRAWLAANPVATGWIISRIREAEHPEVAEMAAADWDAGLEELRDLSDQETRDFEDLVDHNREQARNLVQQWYELQAGDLIGFEEIPDFIRPEPTDRIGAVVVEGLAQSFCEIFDIDHDVMGTEQAEQLHALVLEVLAQGVPIGLSARGEGS